MPDISPEVIVAHRIEQEKPIRLQARRDAFPSGFIFCCDCGSKLTVETMYCSKCGKEVSMMPIVQAVERKAMGRDKPIRTNGVFSDLGKGDWKRRG